ncbi:MAG: hypothetical protein HKN48_07975 [Flavobacteriaceae bacterium]|nr:hypothetical protein [Flavobacteriaceae bacterium]
MEKQFDHLEEFTKKVMKESGLEQPSKGFAASVMNKIIEEGKTVTYTPLISKRGWFIAAILIIACASLFFFLPETEASFITKLPKPELSFAGTFFKDLELSKTMIYGIGFLALFLVQIPFLKRLLEEKVN